MSVFDKCPAEPLSPIVKKDCAFTIGQIRKIAFWKRSQTAPFTATSILTAAAWSTAVTATDPVIVTNSVNGFNIPGSERVDNAAETNLNGLPELRAASNPMATGMFENVSPDELKQLRSLIPVSQITTGESDLVCAFVNTKNEIIYNAEDTSLGFDVYALFVGTPSIAAERGANSMATLNFHLLDDWFEKGAKGQLAFDFIHTYPLAA